MTIYNAGTKLVAIDTRYHEEENGSIVILHEGMECPTDKLEKNVKTWMKIPNYKELTDIHVHSYTEGKFDFFNFRLQIIMKLCKKIESEEIVTDIDKDNFESIDYNILDDVFEKFTKEYKIR